MTEVARLRARVLEAMAPHVDPARVDEERALLAGYVATITETALLEVLAGAAATSSVEELYDRAAPLYERAFPERSHVGESLELLGDAHFAAAVDLGCGTGLSTEALLARAVRVVGVDLSAEMLALAAARLGGRVELARGDFTRRVPLDDASVDLVFSVGATRHIAAGAEDTFFAECARVLRPGGTGLWTFVTPAGGAAGALDAILSRYLAAHGIAERRFAEAEARAAIERAGFTVTSQQTLPPAPLYGKLFVVGRI